MSYKVTELVSKIKGGRSILNSLVIIPSIRNHAVISSYIYNATKHNFDTNELFFLILVEDFSDKDAYITELKQNKVNGIVMNQKDRDDFLKKNDLEELENLIPKRSHAETSFGLVYLWMHKEYEYAFFIDDDTEPENDFDYFGDHIKNLNFTGEITEISSDKNWVNVLYQNYEKRQLYPRGYPYSKKGEKVKRRKTNVNKGDVWISQGLWTNVPDLDAVRILMDGDLNGQSMTRLNISDFSENFVVAKNNFLTICSMNLAIRREVIPFYYQFPMDDNPWRIGRFDDIWSGIIAKKVLDQIQKFIITGFPLCRHNKAVRSTFKDVNLEAPGYESNEYISESLSALKLKSIDIVENSLSISESLENNGKTEFIRYCGNKLKKWVVRISQDIREI